MDMPSSSENLDIEAFQALRIIASPVKKKGIYTGWRSQWSGKGTLKLHNLVGLKMIKYL